MRKVLVALAVVGLLAGAACSSDDGGKKDGGKTPTSPAGPAAATVKASGTTWDPQEVSIKAGDTVEWDVDGSIVHDLHGDEGVSHKAASSFTQTHRYGKPGTYSFQCTIHPGMTGTVTVTP